MNELTHGRSPLRVTEGVVTPLPQVAALAVDERGRWLGAARDESERLRRRFGLPFEPLTFDTQPLSVTVRGVSGTVEVGSWGLEVAPWYSEAGDDWASDVLAMLGRAERHRFDWSLSGGVRRSHAYFVDNLGEAFVDALMSALRHEPIHVYRAVEERTTVLQGRLNWARQLRAIYSEPHILECDVSRLDANNDFNRLLAWACARLARRVRDEGLARRLRLLQGRIPAQPPQVPPLPVRAEPPPQYRVWREPVAIANLVASNLSHVVSETLVDGVSLCVNMPELFERFVEASLQQVLPNLRHPELSFIPQSAAPLAKPHHRPAATFQPRPDGVVLQSGRAVLVLDTKYKQLFRSAGEPLGRFHRADLYQVIASQIAHRCSVGVLLYPTRGMLHRQVPLVWDVEVYDDPLTVRVEELNCRGVGNGDGMRRFDNDLAAMLDGLIAAGRKAAA